MEELKGNQAHTSNTPTLHFSSPHVEKIIKDTQNAMAAHTNIVKQPVVTLNTSVYEVPSQSLESFGEHRSDTGQLVLSTGNNNEIIQANIRKMVIKSKLWDNQREDDEEEGWNTEFAGDSSNEGERCSGDEEMLSVGSPFLSKIGSSSKLNSGSKLNAKTPDLSLKIGTNIVKQAHQQ